MELVTNTPQKRHELKHDINYGDFLALLQRLRVVTRPDSHADENGSYHIRSLYFDNLQDKALREKIDGVDKREKFRIRYYNDDHSLIRLEKKSKVHGLCSKQSAPLTKTECLRLLEGDDGWLRQKEQPLLLEFYSKLQYQQLRPKTLVDYLRYPFVYLAGNVRITLDSQIRTGLFSRDLFQTYARMTPAPGNAIILEVKYDEFIPGVIRDIVQTNNRQAAAFSKYAVCRMYG